MRKSILLAAFALLATQASAETPRMRMNSASMTCQAVQDTIHQHGQVVLRYASKNKPDMMMHNMYVANSTPCVGQGVIGATTVPTSDNPKCKVSYCSPNTGKGSVKGGKK
jgi:hypothetical protein